MRGGIIHANNVMVHWKDACQNINQQPNFQNTIAEVK